MDAFPTTESYSARMAAAVAQMLADSTPAELACLQVYFEIRRGPGLELLLDEMRRRGLLFSINTKPDTAAPVATLPHG